ncbi:MAG: hypothetical protein PHU14_09845 [Methylovulum sp.]|nr:hypothetical protein [Methylovulum sp.]
MLPALRVSLLALLVLLQLLAPLVHAHTGQAVLAGVGKLHIPGLEALSNLQDDSDGYEQAAFAAPAEGVLIGVGNSIKSAQQDVFSDNHIVHYLDMPLWSFNLDYATSETNFSPHIAPIAHRFFLASHPSRAPPFSSLLV